MTAMLRQIAVAVQFLTRLPIPRIGDVSGAEFASSMRWFPLAGLLVGVVVAGAAAIGALTDPWLAALAGTVAWVTVTGGLHLDGLADLTDALGAAHRDPERLIEVMKDVHIGSFGVIALVLQIAAKLVLLRLLAEDGAFLALLPLACAARCGPLLWARLLPPLGKGLGALFARATGGVDLLFWAMAVLLCAWAIPVLLAAPLLIGLWGVFLRIRLGGVNGDCHGAGIEVVETGLLIALVVALRL